MPRPPTPHPTPTLPTHIAAPRREKAINDAQQMMQMQQQMGGAMNPMGFDMEKAFAAERQQLGLVGLPFFASQLLRPTALAGKLLGIGLLGCGMDEEVCKRALSSCHSSFNA